MKKLPNHINNCTQFIVVNLLSGDSSDFVSKDKGIVIGLGIGLFIEIQWAQDSEQSKRTERIMVFEHLII